MPNAEIAEDVLEEGCYYLSELGLPSAEIARHFQVGEDEARRLAASYASKLKAGKVSADPFDRQFWEDVKKEAEGDVKLTFVSDRGFHHSWRSEVSRLDTRALMNIYESSKDFLNADPNQRFLDFPPPTGFDPLATEREVRKAVEVVRSLLEGRWAKEKSDDATRK